MIPANSKCMVVGATNPTSIGFCVALNLLKQGADHVTVMGRCQKKIDESILILANEIDELNLSGKKVHGVLGNLRQQSAIHKIGLGHIIVRF